MDFLKSYSRTVTIGRLSQTLALLALAVMLVAMVPLGFLLSTLLYAFIFAIYILILFTIMVFTLFTILADPNFIALFNFDSAEIIAELQKIAVSISDILPYLLVAIAVLGGIAVFSGWKNPDRMGKKGKTIGLTVLIISVVYTVLYYLVVRDIVVGIVQ